MGERNGACVTPRVCPEDTMRHSTRAELERGEGATARRYNGEVPGLTQSSTSPLG